MLSADHSRVRLSLVAIVLLAAVLRFWGLGYGLPHPTARPDEEIVVGHALDLSLGGISDKDAFPYPDLVYLVEPVRGRPVRQDVTWAYPYPNLVYHLDAMALWGWRSVGQLIGSYDSPADFVESLVLRNPGLQYRISRGVSAVAGTLTVFLTYLVALYAFRRPGVALLAALLVGVNFLHARDSHYATVDVPMTMFATASLAFAMRAGFSRSRIDVLLSACLGGLAAAAKFNGAVILASTGVAAVRRFLTAPDRRIVRLFGLLAGAALVAIIAFAVTTPNSIRDYKMVHLGFRIQQRVLFFGDGPRAWQSILGVTLPGAFGWPAFVFVLIGFARALWKRRYPDIVLLVFLLPAFAAMAGMTWILPRYPLPLVPALAVIAAEALVSVLGRAPRWSVAALVVVLVAQPLDRIVAYDRLASVPDTRQLATDWIAGHVPPRARIAVCRGYGAPVVNADSRVSPSFDREVVNCSLEDIQAAHADYLVTHTHPAVDSLEPTDEARRWLEDHAKPLVTLTPFGTAPRTDTCFFRSDEFYLPYCGLGQVDRGGPEIIVWALPPPR